MFIIKIDFEDRSNIRNRNTEIRNGKPIIKGAKITVSSISKKL